MSDLTFNKIAAGVLASGLAIFLLREVATELFHQEPPEKAGYAIAVVEEVAEGAAAAEVEPDWGTVLPVANIEAGKTATAKCVSCHTFEAGGANGTGPNLFGTVGRKPGTHAGYAYSPAMVEAGASKAPVWDDAHLNAFLANPGKYVPGTKMTFVGLKNVDERINVIAYMRSLGATIPVPAPAPAAAAAPDAAAEGEPTAVDGAAPDATPDAPVAGGAAAPTAVED